MALMCPLGGECIHAKEMEEYISSHGKSTGDDGSASVSHMRECMRINCIQPEKSNIDSDKYEDTNLQVDEYALK